MATVNLSPVGNAMTFFNNLGEVLSGGKIYTYQAGSSTPLTTYTTVNGNIAHANPIILGTDGRSADEIWLLDGYNYKFIIKDSADNTIQTLDNLYGIIGTIPATAPALPSGTIVLWSGAIGSIPSGYLLCNGSNGTPDLRDRFVVGAGNTYSVAQTGGSADAIVVSHTHTATSTSVVTDPGHDHISGDPTDYFGPYGSASLGGSFTMKAGTGTSSSSSLTNTETTGITVATTTTNASAGTSGTNANLPPYYALCYIMKS